MSRLNSVAIDEDVLVEVLVMGKHLFMQKIPSITRNLFEALRNVMEDEKTILPDTATANTLSQKYNTVQAPKFKNT